MSRVIIVQFTSVVKSENEKYPFYDSILMRQSIDIISNPHHRVTINFDFTLRAGYQDRLTTTVTSKVMLKTIVESIKLVLNRY